MRFSSPAFAVITDKRHMRSEARRIRAAASKAATVETASSLSRFFIEGPLAAWVAAHPDTKPVISGYWPFGTEIDTVPLLHQLAGSGYAVALPVTLPVSRILEFRCWHPDMMLTPDSMRIKTPPRSVPVIAPDIIMAASLSFDRSGHRLGYGMGYYDATLQARRASSDIMAVCIAFAAQEVDAVDTGPQDQKVDWIVTERYALQIMSF